MSHGDDAYKDESNWVSTYRGEPIMKRFYNTMSPDTARHILVESEDEAIREARNKVAEDGRTRYVCKIICKIEPDVPPVKITRFE